MTAGVLVVLAMLFVMFSGFWTDWLWYRSVDYSSVFTKTLWTKIGLFAVFGLLMAVAVGFNIWLAHRLRPPLSAMSMEQQSLDRYRMALAPYKKWVLLGATALIGLISGASAAGQWRTWLMWVNGVPFGSKDPQFHKDISFFAFDLPFYRFLLGFGFAAAILSLLAAALVHYLYGGLRVTTPGARATAQATGHLSVLLGVFVALKAVAYWLDRYGLAVKSGDFKATDNWTGLKYVDANAYLPAKTILFIIAIICALLFFATIWRRTWQLPVIGFGLMVLSAILIGGLYPALVQKFQVSPNEQAKETPYIKKNIEATRKAYDIDDAEEQDYRGTSKASNEKLRNAADTTASMRLLDPNVVSPTFQQKQQVRGYYQFPATLDVDRYKKDGKEQDTVVGLREINTNGIPEKNWINEHFKYTHGFGMVAAKGTSVDKDGAPDFTEKDLPPEGDLGEYQGPGLLRGEDDAVLHRRRSAEGTGLRGRQRGEDLHLQGRQRRQPLQPAQPRGLRGQLQRAADPLLGSDRRGLAGPVQAHSQGARGGGRPLADHRRRPLPRGGGRSHQVDRRRLHHLQRLPLLVADDPGGHHGGLADRRAARGGRPAEPGQLHPQLGQGDGGRLHGQGRDVPVGQEGPGAEDLDEGVPRHGEAQERHQ